MLVVDFLQGQADQPLITSPHTMKEIHPVHTLKKRTGNIFEKILSMLYTSNEKNSNKEVDKYVFVAT